MDTRLGADDLQWSIFKALFNNLNTAIVAEETRGHTLDDEFRQLTGRRFLNVKLDPIAKDNFHLGHRPSLIEAPASEWPAIAVNAYAVTPSPRISMDQAIDMRLQVSVECIVKAGPFDLDAEGKMKTDGEEIVDRKIKRTAEAINAVVVAHRYLDGYVFPEEEAPTVTWGEVFARNTATDGTDRQGLLLWQGVRFQFNYNKQSNTFAGFDLDQVS